MSDKQDKRNASQRIEDLERAVMSLYQTVDNMARDLMNLKDAVSLLNNKVSAIVAAAGRSEGINDDTVAAIMVENKVEDLKNKVEELKGRGILAAEALVGENSFVVGREVDDDGKVVNPRLQFTMQGINAGIREKLVGAAPGQVITLEEGKLKFEVLESYAIQTPSVPEQSPAEEAPVAEEAASS